MRVQIPEALEFLLYPKRYKVAYGGRDSAKSWSFARALLIRAYSQPTRILCCREIQRSIKDSVHALLKDQIRALGMEASFKITDHAIVGTNGSEFMFEGLRHNIDSIRSKEAIDVCAVFEANNVSKTSWNTLIPTIRKPGSEIWLEFNPILESDETYQRFIKRAAEHGSDLELHKVTYKDNPYLSAESLREIDKMRMYHPDDYMHVYEGGCRITLEGAIYAQEIRDATMEGRIGRVPYIEGIPVHTFWDFGWSDMTSVWFVQKVGFEYNVIDFFQDRLKKLPHYLQVLQDRRYVYGTDYLPHDAEHESVAAPSIRKQFEAAGHKVKTVTRVPKIDLGIKATRNIWGRIRIDEDKCSEGLQALRHYAYDVDEHGQWSREPKHDENSHAADALRTMGESIGMPDRKPDVPQVQVVQYSKGEESRAWMG